VTDGARTWWRWYATVYDRLWADPLGTALACRVAEVVGDDRCRIVVDVGGGTGLLSSHLVSRGHRVLCVDPSPEMLGRAAARTAAPRCVRARAEALPLATGCADVVVATNVVHLHADPGRVLADCLRILRPGGRLLCSWPRGGLADIARAERRLGVRPIAGLGRVVLRLAVHATAVLFRAARRTDDADIVDALRAISRDIRWMELPDEAQTLAILEAPGRMN
jgi:SAM-dependent methyltransferase